MRRSLDLPAVLDYFNNFSYIGALTLRRAGFQVLLMKAVPRTLRATGGPLSENRPVIDVPEDLGGDGQRPATRMVEKQKPECQLGEIDLITDDFDILVP